MSSRCAQSHRALYLQIAQYRSVLTKSGHWPDTTEVCSRRIAVVSASFSSLSVLRSHSVPFCSINILFYLPNCKNNNAQDFSTAKCTLPSNPFIKKKGRKKNVWGFIASTRKKKRSNVKRLSQPTVYPDTRTNMNCSAMKTSWYV